MNEVTIDYETFFDKENGPSVKSQGNWAYTHDERFDPYLVAVYDGTNSWVGHPKDLDYSSLVGSRLIAHNAGFEQAINVRLAELGKAPATLGPYSCTADMAAFLCSERALAPALRVLEKKVVSKALRDDMSGKGWFDVPASMKKKMAEYCLGDVVEAHGLWEKYKAQWSDFEQRVSEHTRMTCARGVAIDFELLGKYIQILQEALFELAKSLPWVAEGGKPTSPKEIANECRKHGIPAPPVKTYDEEGFEQWLKTYGNRLNNDGTPTFPWVYGVGDWRKLNKMLTTLETIRDRRRPDGTIDFSLLYFGAHTGRWSGGGSGFNLQNQRKNAVAILFRAEGGIRLFELDDKHPVSRITDPGALSVIDMRSLLVPRKGKKFIVCDLSQIEPRVLNWLAGNTQILDLIAAGGFSYYEGYLKLCEPDLAAGWSGEPGTIKEHLGKDAYTLLKNKALGLGFQMGSDRFMEYAGVDKDAAVKAVKSFRESNPKVVALWNALDLAFRNSVGGDFIMELPTGRKLVYKRVERGLRHRMNEEGVIEKKQVYFAHTGLESVELYGGKLAENITQATAREVFATHVLALEKEVAPVVFHVHDEAITECDQDMPVEEVERVMCRTPEWLPGCPVAAEGKEAYRYFKA